MARVAVTLDGTGGVREAHLYALRRAGLEPVLVGDTIGDCRAVYLPGTDYVPSLPGEDPVAGAAETDNTIPRIPISGAAPPCRVRARTGQRARRG